MLLRRAALRAAAGGAGRLFNEFIESSSRTGSAARQSQARSYYYAPGSDPNNLMSSFGQQQHHHHHQQQQEEGRPLGYPPSYEQFWNNLLRGTSSVAALKEWVAAGNTFTRDTLAVTNQRCKCRRMLLQAIELLSWVIETRPFELTEGDFAQLITFCCREKQFAKAEATLRAVPPHLSNSTSFAALVAGYCDWGKIKLVELMVRKARSPLPEVYSSVILMYIREGLYYRIPGLYKRMKALGHEPNVITYTLLLKFKERIGEIPGLEAEALAGLERVDLADICPVKRSSVAGNMINTYAMLGKLDKVEKVWRIMDQERVLPEGFYISTLEALAMLGEVRKAEKVAEMRPTEKVYERLYQALARHYARVGNMRRAEEMLGKHEKMELTPSFGIYNHLVTGYLARKEPAVAASKMRLALKVVKDDRAVPSYAAVMGLLPVLAEEKDLETTEMMVKRYKGWRGEEFHSALLKVYESVDQRPNRHMRKELQKRISSFSVGTRLQVIKAQAKRSKQAMKEAAAAET